ncbi:MAG TPA: YCF48-related protein [Anaerolineaceae bacterium]
MTSIVPANPQCIIYALATSSDYIYGTKGICFAATSDGLYRQEIVHAGQDTWKYAFESLGLNEALPTTSVVLSPDFRKDGKVFAGVNGGILRSHDQGVHWEAVTFPPPSPVVSCLAISPNFVNDEILFAGTMEDGVLTSQDEGRRWVSWNFGLLDLNVLCIGVSPAFARDETVFVGTETGIFRSTNGGRSWREIELPIGYEPVISLGLSPNYEQDGQLIIGTENAGLLRGYDRGKRWEQITICGQEGLDPVNAVLISSRFPEEGEIMALTGARICRSVDAGKSWEVMVEVADGEANICTIAAPRGLGPGHPILIGSLGGKITLLRS